jgi:hypothetical protein
VKRDQSLENKHVLKIQIAHSQLVHCQTTIPISIPQKV